MYHRSLTVVLGAAFAAMLSGILSCTAAGADAPNAPAVRPAAAQAKSVTSVSVSHGRFIAVCTWFPGKVLVDGAGNVYKQPVETDAQGHQRAVGVPLRLVLPGDAGHPLPKK